ncbi:MAG: hypothetical protein ACKERG_00450 [Candidatus Hodgkinia cicadicola]
MTSICKTAIKIGKTEEVKRLIEGESVWGTIKHKNDSFMLVDIGFKTEVKVRNEEVWNYGRFKVGQPIQVYVECLDSIAEGATASRRQLDMDEAWAEAALAQASAAWVKGIIMGCALEGLVISVFGLPSLLPFGLIEKRIWSELTNESTTNVRLLEVDKSRNYILLTKQIDGDGEFAEEDEDDVGEPRIGDGVWGVVREVYEEGVVVDLGWCRGELVLSDVAWYDALKFADSAVNGSVVLTLYGGMVGVSKEDESSEKQENTGKQAETEEREGDGRDADDGGDDDSVAMLFLEESVEDGKEGIVYGIVEEVTEQAVMVRMSPSLVQSVEASVFKADVDKTQAVLPAAELRPPSVGDIVKVLPVCLSLAEKQVELDVDVEGLRYLKFVEANIESAVEGLISGIESNYAIVLLDKDIFGKLEIVELLRDGGVHAEGLKGFAVTVEICDFCSETNTIYLNVADDELTRAALFDISHS